MGIMGRIFRDKKAKNQVIQRMKRKLTEEFDEIDMEVIRLVQDESEIQKRAKEKWEAVRDYDRSHDTNYATLRHGVQASYRLIPVLFRCLLLNLCLYVKIVVWIRYLWELS